MAVTIAFGAALMGGTPLFGPRPRVAESITASGTSQATTATAQRGEVAWVRADVDISVRAVRGSGTVAATDGVPIPAGTATQIGPLEDGDKLAVITS